MMRAHDELEQLSAFLDGELDAAASTQVEAHLATCDECREVLDALRATVGDLRGLASPEPSAQDQWALRAAINRARTKPRSRWQRWAAGSSAAAAALALIVSVAVLGDGGRSDDGGVQAFGTDLRAAPMVEQLDAFDQESARALLPGGASAEDAAAPGAQPLDAAETHERAAQLPADGGGADADQIAACERELFDGDGIERLPLRYIAARYNDVPAFFLLYELPAQERFELWVIARGACSNVLLFEQRAA